MAKSSTAATRRPTQAARNRELRRPAARKSGSQSSISWNIPWTTTNFIGIGVGVVVIIIGYLLMKTAIAADPIHDKSIWNNAGSTSIAPIVLTIGYCIILPVAIFWRKKDATQQGESVEEG